MSPLNIEQGSSSHSAYDLRSHMSDEVETHTLAVLVQNEAGVLARVIGLFSGRGYNIESLTVAEVDHEGHRSRITIVTSGTPQVINQIKMQLDRMVPVHEVSDLTVEGPFVSRELALIKVVAKGEHRVEALRIAEIFRANVVDSTLESFVFEITGTPEKVDAFTELMRPWARCASRGPASPPSRAASDAQKKGAGPPVPKDPAPSDRPYQPVISPASSSAAIFLGVEHAVLVGVERGEVLFGHVGHHEQKLGVAHHAVAIGIDRIGLCQGCARAQQSRQGTRRGSGGRVVAVQWSCQDLPLVSKPGADLTSRTHDRKRRGARVSFPAGFPCAAPCRIAR
jgi:acetolactate synthase-1/3 small subunit